MFRCFLTKLFEHFVALVENEVLEMFQVQLLAPDQGQDPARGTNHDMGAVGLENLLVFGDSHSSKKDADLKFEISF